MRCDRRSNWSDICKFPRFNTKRGVLRLWLASSILRTRIPPEFKSGPGCTTWTATLCNIIAFWALCLEALGLPLYVTSPGFPSAWWGWPHEFRTARHNPLLKGPLTENRWMPAWNSYHIGALGKAYSGYLW